MPPFSVAVFGEVLADVFPDQSVLGGAPFNVARHLQAFGLNPLMISRVGQDALGAALLGEMSRLGMSVSGMQRDPDHPTGQVRVTLDNGSHRFDILPDQAYDFLEAAAARQAVAKVRPQLAYFGTLVQRNDQSRDALAAFISECKCPLFLDVNLRKPWYDTDAIAQSLQAADIVKLNDDELAEVAAMFGCRDLPSAEQAKALRDRFDLQQVLVTCGAAGSWLMDKTGQIICVPSDGAAKTVVDTVGAGDAYSAVFILGRVYGWALEDTMRHASHYAAAICQIRGAVPHQEGFDQPFRDAWQLNGAVT